MRALMKWSCLVLLLTGGALLISTPCFSNDAQNWAAVDRALLDSLQNLKSSMTSVEHSNQALRLENDFYRSQIEAMQQALNPVSVPPPVPPVEMPDVDGKARELKNKILARVTEEHQILQQQSRRLNELIEAKRESIKNFRRQVSDVHGQMDKLQKQMAAMDDAVAENSVDRIRELQESYRQSRDGLLMQERKNQDMNAKAVTVKAVADSELKNKDLWMKMQNLEADLRELSKQGQQLQQKQIDGQSERQKTADDLETEIESLRRQLESVQQEMNGVSSPDVKIADDQVLRDYRQKLQQQNQFLRRQVETLRQVLPD